MADADPHWVRDSLVGDTVDGASASGRTADVAGVQGYIVDVLEKMDRKKAEALPARGPTSPADKAGIYEEEFEKRTGRKLQGLDIERAVPETGRLLTQRELTSGPLASIISRIRVINTKNADGTDKYPAMRAQMKNLTVCMNSPRKSVRQQAAHTLYGLLDKTDKIVGYSWAKPAPTILTF